MFKKKNLMINCDLCDARKVKEEDLAGYEQIMINTDVILVDERSKGVLERLPLMCNTDRTLEIDEDVEVSVQNGNYVIDGQTAVTGKTLLVVNGDLEIRQDSGKELLESYTAVTVNGSLLSPVSLLPLLHNLSVNGTTRTYPDDCAVLDAAFTPDAYFHLRAKEGRRYFVSEEVRLTDPKADIRALKEKKIHFVSPRFLVPEEKVTDAVELFDEMAQMEVIPSGMVYAGENVLLDQKLLQQYGKRMYIRGDLTLNGQSGEVLALVQELYVAGTVYVPEELKVAFLESDARYDKLEIVQEEKRRILENRPMFRLDNTILDASPDGVLIRNCATLKIKEDVEPQRIIELAEIWNCAEVTCTEEQKGAVELISKNVAHIRGEKEEASDGGVMGVLRNIANTKIVNADQYIL